MLGLNTYRTPLKHWLNDAASKGRDLPAESLESMRDSWLLALSNARKLFPAGRAFKRPGARAINRALFDLVMDTCSRVSSEFVSQSVDAFWSAFENLLRDEEFQDLIGRSVDHRARTQRRFALWQEHINSAVFKL